MLDSLKIKKYRNLKDLTMNSLGRVNLITGKNNTGKSTLLEAVAIYAAEGNLGFINQILEERGEITRTISKSPIDPLQSNIKALSSLFNDWTVGFDTKDTISIDGIDNTFTEKKISSKNTVLLRFAKYFEEESKDEQGDTIKRRKFVQNDSETVENYKIGFEIKTGDSSRLLPLEDGRFFRRFFIKPSNSNIQIANTRNLDRDANSALFDNIALTDKEQNVIKALRIIEPSTERIAFIEETSGKRKAVIKLSGSQSILPLQSMGDGMNRILTIILALVNAGNGYLLIDEFENGLHYTVQEKLWTILFQLSKELNIQVFATTHSEDCIRGFQRVLNNQDNLSDGKLIRLDNVNGNIKQVVFDAKELKIATDQDIEIR